MIIFEIYNYNIVLLALIILKHPVVIEAVCSGCWKLLDFVDADNGKRRNKHLEIWYKFLYVL